MRSLAVWCTAVLAAAVAFTPLAVRAQSVPEPGPCEQPGAIVDRPGLGKPTANNGSPCVVPPSQVIVEAGYRAQATAGGNGTSTLEAFALVLIRTGLGARSEIVVQPPAASVRGEATLGGTFVPATGAQDIGFGLKRMLDDRSSFQDSVGLFYTAPTGRRRDTVGFSAGAPTYTLTYTAAFAATPNVAVSITQNAIANAVPLSAAGAARFSPTSRR